MIVNENDGRVDAVVTTITTSVPFDFAILNADEIEVLIDGVVLNPTLYTVNDVGNESGGSITISNLDGTITILRKQPVKQVSDYQPNEDFPADRLENDLGKIVMGLQQIREMLNRSLIFGKSSLKSGIVVDPPVSGQFLRWKDNDGNVDSAVPTPSGTIGLPLVTSDGGTGASYASIAALAKGLGLALWGGSNGGSATLTVTSTIGQLPNPLTTNIFTCATNIAGLLTASSVVGQVIKIYWNAASVVATHSATFMLLNRRSYTFTTGDISEFIYVGGGIWTEFSRRLTTEANRHSAIGGLGIVNNVGDATNDIDISVGARWSDDTVFSDRQYIELATALTKQLDAAWAVGTNAGMLATGVAIANGTYHIFVIMRPDTGVVDIAADSSVTGANIAGNTNAAYTKKWRIASILRESGVIVPFIQDRHYFRRATAAPVVTTGLNPGTSAISITLQVPLGLSVFALFNADHDNDANALIAYVSDLASVDLAPSASVAPLGSSGVSLTAGAIVQKTWSDRIRTDTLGRIRLRLSHSTTNVIVRFSVLGWDDYASQG